MENNRFMRLSEDHKNKDIARIDHKIFTCDYIDSEDLLSFLHDELEVFEDEFTFLDDVFQKIEIEFEKKKLPTLIEHIQDISEDRMQYLEEVISFINDKIDDIENDACVDENEEHSQYYYSQRGCIRK